ncbi:MAG: Hsp20/alpha crystallin family protein [Candidatus Melainabacteria bacterium]|nr:Hsp20/alpha crystallin family protein [Candidatus Melainabacteria bacterium]
MSKVALLLSVLSPALMGGSQALAQKPDESEMLLQKLLDKEMSGTLEPSLSRPEIYLHIGEQVKKVEDGPLSSFKAASNSPEGVKQLNESEGNCLLYVKTEESPDKIRILAKLNGFEKGTIDIFVTSSEFSIKGFEARQIRGKTQKQELMSAQKDTAFERTFSLPHHVETKSARAVFHGGEIEVLLPKQNKPGEAM